MRRERHNSSSRICRCCSVARRWRFMLLFCWFTASSHRSHMHTVHTLFFCRLDTQYFQELHVVFHNVLCSLPATTHRKHSLCNIRNTPGEVSEVHHSAKTLFEHQGCRRRKSSLHKAKATIGGPSLMGPSGLQILQRK